MGIQRLEIKKDEKVEEIKNTFKNKNKSSLTRAEKDELLFKLCELHGITIQ